jgi:hypothetical protein
MSVQHSPKSSADTEADLAAQQRTPRPQPFLADQALQTAFSAERDRSERVLEAKFEALSKSLVSQIKSALTPSPPPPPPPPSAVKPAPEPKGETPLSEAQAFARIQAEHQAELDALAAHFGRPPPSALTVPPVTGGAVAAAYAPPTFVDAPRPLRRSPLGYNQQLDAGGSEASKLAVVTADQGFVPVNQTYRLGERPAGHLPGKPIDVRAYFDYEALDCNRLWDKKKPGTKNDVFSARDKHEWRTSRAVTDALGDIIGYLQGDPAGRVDSALPELKKCFEVLALRCGAIEAGAYADMGYLSSDRSATFRALKTDEEEEFLSRHLPPAIAGRLMSLSAKTTEAVFNETAKQRAKEKVAALTKGGGGDDGR